MQSVIVWLIILVAALYVGRRYARSLSGKNQQGCDCGSPCDTCGGANQTGCCPPPAEKRGNSDQPPTP